MGAFEAAINVILLLNIVVITYLSVLFTNKLKLLEKYNDKEYFKETTKPIRIFMFLMGFAICASSIYEMFQDRLFHSVLLFIGAIVLMAFAIVKRKTFTSSSEKTYKEIALDVFTALITIGLAWQYQHNIVLIAVLYLILSTYIIFRQKFKE